MIKTQVVKIEPNSHMNSEIKSLFDYRRYSWNKALELWNKMYDESIIVDDMSLRPSGRKVRDTLVALKEDWEYCLSSRVLQQTVISLEKAWKNYFNKAMPNHKRPKFKSSKNYQPTFTTDRARIKDGKLVLDKSQLVKKTAWYPIRMHEKIRFEGELKTCTITEKADGLYASLTFETSHQASIPVKQDIAGVDVNVRRFNYNDGVVWVYPDTLKHYYEKIKYYQRILARKRKANKNNYKTKRYAEVRTKLRRLYQKVYNLQNDLIQKFTTQLISKYSEIHIEDLNVHGMMMSKRMGKNLHRSMFGRFSEVLKYKAEWNNRELILVDRFYASTQICSECGFQKTDDSYGGKQTLTGDSIYRDHQTYRCYECGAVLDRDANAVQNIINFKVAG